MPILNPKLDLSMEKTMIVIVIGELTLTSIYRLKIFYYFTPEPVDVTPSYTTHTHAQALENLKSPKKDLSSQIFLLPPPPYFSLKHANKSISDLRFHC